MRNTRAFPLCLSALLLAACTQSKPAPIALRGSESFSTRSYAARDSSSYATLSPAAGGPTQSAARVEPIRESISVSDLPPPPGAKSSAPAAASDKHSSTPAFIWPVEGRQISHFGAGANGQRSDGIHIAAREGTPVRASADGEVAYAGDELKGYGNTVLLRHKDGRYSSYAHLSHVAVSRYDRVQQGDVIGKVGATGGVPAPQLYFSLREGAEPVNPERFLPKNYAMN